MIRGPEGVGRSVQGVESQGGATETIRAALGKGSGTGGIGSASPTLRLPYQPAAREATPAQDLTSHRIIGPGVHPEVARILRERNDPAVPLHELR